MNLHGINKVRVFISSNCDKAPDKENGNYKYSVMRKSLKLLLEETNICEVYVFEEGASTSYDVVSSYTGPLDDADVVIAIVDNKDGAGSGTQTELNRIRALNKKCLYIFCDEREKTPTEIQNQLLLSTRNPRFSIVHEFSDIPQKAYESVITDIVSIYENYCRGRVDYIEDNQIDNSVNSGMELSVAEDSDITKDFMSEFPYTRFIVKNEAGIVFEKAVNPSLKDKNCGNLLGLIIGSSYTDAPDFSAIKRDVRQMHKGNIQKLVSIRYEAVEAYFDGNLEECLKKLEEALEFIEKCKNIPKWVLNDVAIDLRNMQLEIDQEKGKITFHSHGQTILDDDNEPLYYPVIDRIVADYNEGIIKTRFNKSTQSPYTVNIGGVDYTLEKVSNAFVVAYYYGSITHMLLTCKRIYNYILGVALEVRDHKMFLFAVRLLLLSNEEKMLSQFLNVYGENTNNINGTDIEELIKSLEKQSVKSRRILAKEIIMKFFGYYYSDEMFHTEISNLLSVVKESVETGYGAGMFVKPLLDIFRENSYRINESDALEFVYCIFENKYKRYYDDAFIFLYKFRFSKITKEEQKKYQKFIIESLQNDEIRENAHMIFQAAQTLRQLEEIDHSPLDKAIKKYNVQFFENTYCLNVEEHDAKKGWEYTSRFVDDINRDNVNQGKNGSYTGHAYDSYLTISNILINDNLTYSSSQLKKICEALRGTLFAKTQTIEAKVRALELLCVLQLHQPLNRQVGKIYREIIEKQEIVQDAKDIFLVKGYSKANLELNILLLGFFCNRPNESGLGVKLVGIQNSEISELITTLSFLERLYKNFDLQKCLGSNYDTLFQFILNESYHKNTDVRFHAMSVLSRIRTEKYREVCLERFVSIMDNEDYKGKVGLLYRLEESDLKNSKVQYIFQKGKTDSHYWVRTAANRFDGN